jgi:hypothetical protein
MTLLFFDINSFVNNIFNGVPKPPCTYSIRFKDIPIEKRNKLLFKICVIGAKKLFGDSITIDNITSHQFHTLNKYLQSMGYQINYSKLPTESNYRIWFDQIQVLTMCSGLLLFQKK